MDGKRKDEAQVQHVDLRKHPEVVAAIVSEFRDRISQLNHYSGVNAAFTGQFPMVNRMQYFIKETARQVACRHITHELVEEGYGYE